MPLPTIMVESCSKMISWKRGRSEIAGVRCSDRLNNELQIEKQSRRSCQGKGESTNLEASGGGKTHPNGDEAAVEAGGALGLEDFHDAVDGAAVDLGVRGLVHEARAHHVEGGDLNSHGGERGCEPYRTKRGREREREREREKMLVHWLPSREDKVNPARAGTGRP